jgi:hypothetical protein
MKIWFRTDPEEGSGQADEQSRRQDCYVDSMSLWPLLWPVSSGTPLIENRADHSLRRAAACSARCSAADVHHPLADACSTSAAIHPRHFTRNAAARRLLAQLKKRVETAQLSGKSNRNWPTNRSYRKQTIKPSLTGTRTAISNLRFLASFLATETAKIPGNQSVSKRPMPKARI